jgi:hypothetical protein
MRAATRHSTTIAAHDHDSGRRQPNSHQYDDGTPRMGAPETSNKIMQKGLASSGRKSGTVSGFGR